MSTHPAIDAFLVRFRHWWEAQDNELARMDSSELSRIARDYGMSWLVGDTAKCRDVSWDCGSRLVIGHVTVGAEAINQLRALGR